jgi:hypothetical protein
MRSVAPAPDVTMRARWRRRLALAATALAASGCAVSRPQLSDGVFRAPELFRVAVPGDDWTVTRAGASELELRHPASRAGILANADCGPGTAREELPRLARRLFVGLRARDTVTNGAATLAGRPAVHAVLEARVPGEEERMRVEAYVMKDDRCVYDLVYVAPAGAFAARRDDFQRFVESFVKE